VLKVFSVKQSVHSRIDLTVDLSRNYQLGGGRYWLGVNLDLVDGK